MITAMAELNQDILLGSAIQLIKDIEKITFLGERMECLKVNQMAKEWLKGFDSSRAGEEEQDG